MIKRIVVCRAPDSLAQDERSAVRFLKRKLGIITFSPHLSTWHKWPRGYSGWCWRGPRWSGCWGWWRWPRPSCWTPPTSSQARRSQPPLQSAGPPGSAYAPPSPSPSAWWAPGFWPDNHYLSSFSIISPHLLRQHSVIPGAGGEAEWRHRVSVTFLHSLQWGPEPERKSWEAAEYKIYLRPTCWGSPAPPRRPPCCWPRRTRRASCRCSGRSRWCPPRSYSGRKLEN